MRVAIIVAAHDGLISLSTGVGVVVSTFLEAFEDIKKKSRALNGHDTSLICLAPYLKPESPDFKQELKSFTEETCRANNGLLILIPTLSDGMSQNSVWGGPSQWKSASLSVATSLTSIQHRFDLIILLAHDTIFSLVRKFIPDNPKLKILWIPHSLGAVFKDEYSDSVRLQIENESIRHFIESPGDAVAHVGNYYKEVLTRGYGVSEEKLIDVTNGIYSSSSRFKVGVKQERNDQERIKSKNKLIFCWGRCVDQKGYDLLIPAFSKFIRNNSDYHLVLLMPTETSPNEYVSSIKAQLSSLPDSSYTAIFEFSRTFPISVLRDQRLEIVVFPYRYEGSPLTPIEALHLAINKVKLLYSPIPQHTEIFKGVALALMFQEFTLDSLLWGLTKISRFTTNGLSRPRCTDFVNSYSNGLDDFMDA